MSNIKRQYDEWYRQMAERDWTNPYVDDLLRPSCKHTWKLYEGFTSRYEFCTECEAKRDV